MLNINQNFDLKAPVFNFDRDYFNSVEELNAYDTSNVPNHFVTNVAGMLYLFTDGLWLPMIWTQLDDPDIPETALRYLNLIDENCYLLKDPNSSSLSFTISDDENSITMDNSGFINMFSPANYAPAISIINGRNDERREVVITAAPNDMVGLSATLKNATDNNKIVLDALHGFVHNTTDKTTGEFNGYHIYLDDGDSNVEINPGIISYKINNKRTIYLRSASDTNSLTIGSDEKFKISRPMGNTEGATITGVESITAFANPSATKVWATDGSTVDLSTKANTSDLNAKANKSDIVLKKDVEGGYYIERRGSGILGYKAFCANDLNTASGEFSFAEGNSTDATGIGSHAEGSLTSAENFGAHAEGYMTRAKASCSHAEGDGTNANVYAAHAEGKGTNANGYAAHAEGKGTNASGYSSHALGAYNVDNVHAIHSVGIGNYTTNKNAEYIYAKTNESGTTLTDDPKNGYKYLIGVGGYDGISTDNTTYKSVQEVIADLTARIEQLETKVRALEAANTPA